VPTATKTFTVELDGDLIEIRAGLDYVADGHELVRRFPGCFLADRGTAGRGRQRSAGQSLREPQAPAPLLDAHERAPAKVRTHGRPSLRRGQPRLTVALGSSARRSIEEEFLSTTCAAGLESGGWLYAPASRSWDKEIEIRLASTPGKGARCAPESYFPSADYHAEEAQFADLGFDIVRVGDWHSHPGRNAGASDGDIDAWLKSFLVANEKRGVASYVGLIVAEDDSRGVVRAKFKAFALSYDRSGRVACEPADLSISGRN
jgi:hypothetical protein